MRRVDQHDWFIPHCLETCPNNDDVDASAAIKIRNSGALQINSRVCGQLVCHCWVQSPGIKNGSLILLQCILYNHCRLELYSQKENGGGSMWK